MTERGGCLQTASRGDDHQSGVCEASHKGKANPLLRALRVEGARPSQGAPPKHHTPAAEVADGGGGGDYNPQQRLLMVVAV